MMAKKFEYRERSAADLDARIDSYSKPWNRSAKLILKDHGDKLEDAEREFVTAMLKRVKTPPDKDLERLAAIALRLGA